MYTHTLLAPCETHAKFEVCSWIHIQVTSKCDYYYVPQVPRTYCRYLWTRKHCNKTFTYMCISQRGFSPFVYRDRGGWPAPLPYIRKIRVSVAIGTQSGILFTKGYLQSKYGGPQKMTKIGLQESC